jgi:mannosyltransferase
VIAQLRARVSRWVDSASFPSESTAVWIALAIVVPVVAWLWLAPLTSSFWLDETFTIWAIRGSFEEMLARSSQVPVQELPFFALTWLAAQLGGSLEVAVRLPSTVAAIVAAAGVYCVGRRFTDRLPAILAVAVFSTTSTVRFAAADARPYALTMAAVVWCVYSLLRWCDSRKVGHGVLFAALAAASIYLHYIAAVMLAVHAYHVARRDSASRPGFRQIVIVTTTLGLFLLPVIAHVADLWATRGLYTFASTPGTRELLNEIVNVQLVVAFVVAAFAARIFAPNYLFNARVVFGTSGGFLLFWCLLPPVSLYVVSLASDAKLFVPRYVMWGAPGLSLLGGLVLSAVEPLNVRRLLGVIAVVVVCARVSATGATAHGGEDWRGALRQAQIAMTERDAPLLLQVDLDKTRTGPSTEPAGRDDTELAPLVPYPVTGDVFVLPAMLDSATERRLELLVSARLLQQQRVVLLARWGSPRTDIWLRARLSAAGFRVKSLGNFGEITALQWDRP